MTVTLHPLPIHVPAYPGETVESFARRAAAANHTTVADIDAGLRYHQLLTSRSRRGGHQRAAVWRELGDLPHDAFTAPASFHGHLVVARPMCPNCADDYTVIAHQPHLGMICLDHQRTLEPPHTPIGHLPELLAAERRFRRLHHTRKLVVDSPAMVIARKTALLTYTPHDHPGPIGPLAIMIYRHQVNIAATITDHTFLETACSTTTPANHRRNYIATRVARATGTNRNHIGRAVQYLWVAIDTITEYLRAVDCGYRTFTDTAHDLLPYLAPHLHDRTAP
jgi:hypothetical protein